ncbi:MAG TPA: hypothetical protein VGA97_09965 [Acidimicrobiia bacterium]
MGLGASLKLVGAGFAWRAFGPGPAGRALLDATASKDEQERMLAVIPLVKAGERTVELIGEAAERGTLTPQGVRLLADIGGGRSKTLLTEIATHPGDLGEAATLSLETLRRREVWREDDGGH